MHSLTFIISESISDNISITNTFISLQVSIANSSTIVLHNGRSLNSLFPSEVNMVLRNSQKYLFNKRCSSVSDGIRIDVTSLERKQRSVE